MATSAQNLPAPLHYRIEARDLHAHLFQVTLTIARPLALQRVSLPVWIPGSYLVREFSKNLQGLQAQQGAGAPLAVEQLDKCSWQIQCAPAKALVLRYQVYAHDNSVRSALYALGFGKEHTWHGFRASARTMLVDQLNLDLWRLKRTWPMR